MGTCICSSEGEVVVLRTEHFDGGRGKGEDESVMLFCNVEEVFGGTSALYDVLFWLRC